MGVSVRASCRPPLTDEASPDQHGNGALEAQHKDTLGSAHLKQLLSQTYTIRANPLLEPLRRDVRYPRLLARLGVPQ